MKNRVYIFTSKKREIFTSGPKAEEKTLVNH